MKDSLQQEIDSITDRFRRGFWLHRVPKNTKQSKDIEEFLRESLSSIAAHARQEGKNEVVDYIEKNAGIEYWYGEKESYQISVKALNAIRTSKTPL